MKTVIVTGASRGIGAALASLLLEQGCRVVGIARQFKEDIHPELHAIEADLGKAEMLEAVMSRAVTLADPSDEGIYLVNNAAVLQPLKELDRCEPAEIETHLRINLIAPMVLSGAFARMTASFHGERRILNVSSASAFILLPGMSVYCTGKAGMDTFTKVMGMEQQGRTNPVLVASVWPGMIDTDMQKEAREQEASTFPSASIFTGAKANGRLTTPADTAGRLSDLLFRHDFPQGEVITQL